MLKIETRGTGLGTPLPQFDLKAWCQLMGVPYNWFGPIICTTVPGDNASYCEFHFRGKTYSFQFDMPLMLTGAGDYIEQIIGFVEIAVDEWLAE